MATSPHGDPEENGTDEILEVLAATVFATHRFEIGPGDMQCYGIPKGKCACCGGTASRSVYHLKRRERTLLCGVCRR